MCPPQTGSDRTLLGLFDAQVWVVRKVSSDEVSELVG